jgi:1-acyl-sn-glycerol-3-phosphate acyltransferase
MADKLQEKASKIPNITIDMFPGFPATKVIFDNLENAVVVCNHNSLLDIPVSFPFLPRANKTIAKKSLSKVPIFGDILSLFSTLDLVWKGVCG